MGLVKIPHAAKEKFESNFSAIIDKGELAEGAWNNAFANFVKNYTEAETACPTSSNGAGLLAILIALRDMYDKKNIFVQSNTMYGVKTLAISSGLKYLGAVDCSISSLMPSADQVKRFISNIELPNQSVFLLSHIGGNINPEIIEIIDICEKAGVVVVEDCAHSFGSTLNNIHSGLFGFAGVYSLYATKSIPAGEGGVVVSKNKEIGEIVNKFNIYDRFDRQLNIGVNFRMSEIQALFCLSVSECIDEIIKNKLSIVKQYEKACSLSEIKFIPSPINGISNHYKFILVANKNINEFSTIKTRTSQVYEYALGQDPENIVKRHICLPTWYMLDDKVVSEVLDQINKFKS